MKSNLENRQQSPNWCSCIVWHSIAEDCFALHNSACLLIRHAVYVDYLFIVKFVKLVNLLFPFVFLLVHSGEIKISKSCIQFKHRTNRPKIIQDVHSAFSPDQFVLNVCSAATRLQRRRHKSRLRRSTLPRPVYKSSFWASKEEYETSRDRAAMVRSVAERRGVGWLGRTLWRAGRGVVIASSVSRQLMRLNFISSRHVRLWIYIMSCGGNDISVTTWPA